ncbi:hypothetical protein [Butyrivibrio sp. INlla14]|uniref:hypothetical protein n=1 Tax=Butyrivibrio sp. INlla14 TaxID=1520808 RepID=UPI0008767607|nr:hypothetical protein [Butyrivibrio sp. INlla14]SCY47761.1 hypothetical protein SAMN02910371_02462 [Butyrivibrio sp. INlla14]
MKCVKCECEMIQAELTGNSIYPLILKNKRNGILDSEKRRASHCEEKFTVTGTYI